MDLSRSFARWYIQNISLGGIPEGGPIVDRFFDVYWDARKLRRDLIRKEYPSPVDKLGINYRIGSDENDNSLDELEMKYALGVRSRVMFPISLQTASIAMANDFSGQPLVDVVADQMLAYGEATIGDDFHDEVLMPEYLKRRGYETPKTIFEIIKSPDKLEATAENIFHNTLTNPKVPHPICLLNASLKQADMYKRRMSTKSPQAYETYLKAKNELYKVQARSLFISAALARGDIQKIKEELRIGDRGYVQYAVSLGDKLAYIGQENAAIVFEATQPSTIPEERARDIKDGLRLFYHGSTLLKQFTEDDSLRLKKDIEKRADNLWVLLSLQENEGVSKKSVRLYLKSNPQITQMVLSPSVQEIKDGYHKLKDLDFGVSDLKLAIGLVTRQAERDMKKFERKLGISLDTEWLKEAIGLRESL